MSLLDVPLRNVPPAVAAGPTSDLPQAGDRAGIAPVATADADDGQIQARTRFTDCRGPHWPLFLLGVVGARSAAAPAEHPIEHAMREIPTRVGRSATGTAHVVIVAGGEDRRPLASGPIVYATDLVGQVGDA